jgi:hypothetical protein
MSSGEAPSIDRRIFLSYRREDSSGYAGRLFDALSEAFGEASVFMDIDTIAPGQDFVQVIDEALVRCEVALVLIGPNWLAMADRHGRRRLDNDGDFVRMEIEGALTRNIRVLPVLVGGADMPGGTELPPSIAGIARRHAVEISDRRWHSDVRDLVSALQRSTIPARTVAPPPEPPVAMAATPAPYAPPPPPPPAAWTAPQAQPQPQPQPQVQRPQWATPPAVPQPAARKGFQWTNRNIIIVICLGVLLLAIIMFAAFGTGSSAVVNQ